MPHPDDFKEDYEHRRGDWSGEHPSLFDEVMDFVDDALETILFDPVKPMKLIDKGEYEEAAEDILWEMTTGKFKKAGKLGKSGLEKVNKLFKDAPNPKKGKKAKDSGKNEPHGDQNAMTKAEKQIQDYNEKIKNAPNKKERDFWKKKIEHIEKNAQRQKKGPHHGQRGKKKKR